MLLGAAMLTPRAGHVIDAGGPTATRGPNPVAFAEGAGEGVGDGAAEWVGTGVGVGFPPGL